MGSMLIGCECAEEEGQDEYLLALESSDMANLCADVAALGFLGGAGVTPGRLLRVAHALTRVALMTLTGMGSSWCESSLLQDSTFPTVTGADPCQRPHCHNLVPHPIVQVCKTSRAAAGEVLVLTDTAPSQVLNLH